MIVDATCGYGPGYLPTAGPVQAPGSPPREVAGILHVKLDMLPALVPVTATSAYVANAAPYLERLARTALLGTPDPAIEAARIASGGRLVHPVAHSTHGSTAFSHDQPGRIRPARRTVRRGDQPGPRAGPAGGTAPARVAVAEMPSGTGHFLPAYSAAGVGITLVDACPQMLTAAQAEPPRAASRSRPCAAGSRTFRAGRGRST